MTRLTDYGLPLFSYAGRGTVDYEGGGVREIDFEAGQMRDGKVRIVASLPNPSVEDTFRAVWDAREPVRFTGSTRSGEQVSVHGSIRLESVGGGSESQSVCQAIRVNQLRVEFPLAAPICEYRFGLTNAPLWGVASVGYLTDGNRSISSVVPFKLTSGGFTVDVMLVRTTNSNERFRAVTLLRGIDVLSELIVPHRDDLTMNEIERVVDDVCHVLSIARGSKVNWIYREDRDYEGRLVARSHQARVTKKYSPCAPIDDSPEFRQETLTLLTGGLATYRARRDDLRLNQGVIDAYIDAKAEADFLQARGAKVAVAIEMLKSTFLKSTAASGAEYVLDDGQFTSLLPTLVSSLDAAMKNVGVSANERNAIASAGKLKGLNRRSFRSILLRLLKYLDLSVPDRELKLFIAARNKLVHEGCFYADCANDVERAELPPLATATAEYLFLVSFLDRLFLRALDYRGRYRDFRWFGETDDVREL